MLANLVFQNCPKMLRLSSLIIKLAAFGCFLMTYSSLSSAAISLSQDPTESTTILRLDEPSFKEEMMSNPLPELHLRTSFRNLATMSADSNASGTGWVGIQALTAFFVIIAAVAFALFLRPSAINRSQYQPV